jgi:RNA polymerase sigma factor (sigma-70 family)
MMLGKEMCQDFYTKNWSGMVFRAVEYVKDRQIAEDIVEDQLIKAMDNTFNNVSQFVCYINECVKNACINHVEKEKRWEVYYSTHADIYYNNELSPEEMMCAKIKSEFIKQTLKEVLPPECFKVITMLYFSKYTPNEIAGKLGLHISTVKNQKARGLELLRKRFGTTKEQANVNNMKLIQKIKNSTMRLSRIAKLYGMSESRVSSIIDGPAMFLCHKV